MADADGGAGRPWPGVPAGAGAFTVAPDASAIAVINIMQREKLAENALRSALNGMLDVVDAYVRESSAAIVAASKTCSGRSRFSVRSAACFGPARRSWYRFPIGAFQPRRWRSGSRCSRRINSG